MLSQRLSMVVTVAVVGSGARMLGAMPVPVEARLDVLFAPLFATCLVCGRREVASGGCGCEATDLGQSSEQVPELIGARLPAGRRSPAATVIRLVSDSVEAVDDEAEVATVPVKRAATQAEVLTVGNSVPERLLAAAFAWGLPRAAKDRVLSEAVRAAQRAVPKTQCAFAASAFANGRGDLTAEVPLPGATRDWLEASGMVRRGRLVDAAERLLDLPSGSFPARLAVWSQAAADLSPSLREHVVGELDAFLGVDMAQDLAVGVVRTALLAGHTRAADGAIPPSLGQEATEHLRVDCLRRARQAGTPAVKLLAALDDGRSDAVGSELLEFAPAALLDDLIDDGMLDAGWEEQDLPQRVREHLSARLEPSLLDDVAVERRGIVAEQARRALLASRPLPVEVLEAAGEPYRSIADLLAGHVDSAAVRALVEDDDQRAVIEELLSGPGEAVPGEWFLEVGPAASIWEHLATSRLKLEALDRSELSPVQQRFVGAVALRRSRAALYAWDEPGAERLARECLRLCGEEEQRDEALNLIACAGWLRGDDEAAIRALEAALAGDYTYALQANIGIVARELAPDVAGMHLAGLVRDAPNLPLRLAAARLAVAIWAIDDLADGTRNDLPRNLALALRDLLNEPLTGEDFRPLARLMATHDADWMAGFNSRPGPNAGSPAARLFSARAEGFERYVKVLAQLLNRPAGQEPWLKAERDDLLAMVRDGLLDEDSQLQAASVVEMLIEEGLPTPEADGITLRSLATWVFVRTILAEGRGEPADWLLDRLIDDRKRLAHLAPTDREQAEIAVAGAFDVVSRAYLVARWEQLQEAADFHDRLLEQLYSIPRMRRNQRLISEALAKLETFAGDTRRLLRRLRPYVDDDELLADIGELETHCKRLAETARQNLGR